MQLAYTEMQGAGNRILIVDGRGGKCPPPDRDRIVSLAAGDGGPGFDQLMWLGPPSSSTATASYRVFNADGSEVEQCGNGARCLAGMLANELDLSRVLLDSPAGQVDARLTPDGSIAVSMGAPEFAPEKVPFVAEKAQKRYEIDIGDTVLAASVLSMGNPHCVLQVNDVAKADVAGLGRLLEHHDRFPERTNVGFCRIRDRRHIELRVHERGAGETPACGTGACAAVVAGHQLGELDDNVSVRLPGGQLVVSWRGPGQPVWLCGPIDWISEGTIDL